MYYHLVLQQIYVVNTVQKIHLISVSSLYQQITTLFCPVCSHEKNFYSFLWKSPNNEESNAIKGKNVTKKSYNVHALILKKSWVTNKISCFYWCVSNDRNQFWLSILYDETINMQNTFMFNCSLCAIEARFFCLIFNLSLTNTKIVTNWGKPQYMLTVPIWVHRPVPMGKEIVKS